jgi:hypothetical protein
MKTTITTLALLTTLLLTNSFNINASNFSLKEEAYINDIPFNTKEIVAEKALAIFQLEDEAYINDIPFETDVVAANSTAKETPAKTVDFAVENYIDDIPFDTESIVETIKFKKAISVDFELEEETYIDDIPFNTAAVANSSLVSLSL